MMVNGRTRNGLEKASSLWRPDTFMKEDGMRTKPAALAFSATQMEDKSMHIGLKDI